MDAAPTPTHRTVAVVGATGAGKTTLIEALLHRAGAVPRAGRVEDGSTVCDHEPEEIARGMSLGLSLATLAWTCPDGAERTLTLADTPGHPDFVGAVDTALAVADLALVVVSAVDGVQPGTWSAWSTAETLGVPRLVVVTQEDRARADFRRVLAELREAFGQHLWPIELPLDEEQSFRSIADVLSEQALVYDDAGRHHDEALPPEAVDEEHRMHVDVTEELVSHDDEQLDAYLSGQEPPAADLERTLAREVASGEAVPVVVSSGVTETGVDRLADLLCELAPAPTERDGRIVVGVGADDDDTEGQVVPVAADPDGEPLVHVFRTVADPYVGQVSMLKVLSGVVRTSDRLRNATTATEERLHGLFRLQGKEHLPVDHLAAGEVGAVAKLAGSPSGTLLWSRPSGRARPYLPPRRPPVYAATLVPASQSDDERMSTALARLVAEDPTLVIDRTGDATVLRGLGDTHLAVAVERLARVFGVHVETGPVPVAYHETIARPAQAEGKVKKQSGGHGQFAVVQLRVSPLPGGGFEFVDSVVGGAVPRQYIAAVEKGARDAMAAGGPQGYPVVDLRVELYDGKSHSVDSSDMAFRTAAAAGVKAALAEAGTVLLEPVANVTVTVPPEHQGAVLTDLSGRRGRVAATEMADDGRARVVATVPESELTRYVLDLRSLTGGRAELTVEPAGYERAPSTVRT
ncbi:translation factor GTPase family protein [Isoptericola variabilis]|uniref:Small GTP-binding protein n=1 Tax=Isoptericola variabilis (strain 225) TaxID=743718 RepID=F6FX17_ISOV2|nr:elongation factor G [Isoptericola variabilis]AEG44617.1 small GTP-binding protein [Isoptericola variabilis 225]TWH28066.1 elongation factor G [Isoptericola variabilis J7]